MTLSYCIVVNLMVPVIALSLPTSLAPPQACRIRDLEVASASSSSSLYTAASPIVPTDYSFGAFLMESALPVEISLKYSLMMSCFVFRLLAFARDSPNNSSLLLRFFFFFPSSFGLMCRLPAQILLFTFCLPCGSFAFAWAFSICLKLPPCFSICSLRNLLPMPRYELYRI